jgi:hypothetical protein
VCPDTIEVFEPDVLSVDNDETGHTQVRLVSYVPAEYPFFEFPSFLTKTKACPAQEYWISLGNEEVIIPNGIIDNNSQCEKNGTSACDDVSGVVYT